MRVTHVITRLIIGGAQENTAASVLGLARLPGLQVDLISGPTFGPEGSLEPELSQTGLLTIAPDLIRNPQPWRDFLAYRWLARRFLQTAPFIVHTHSGKAGILGRMAARRARTPIIIHTIHGPSFGPFQGVSANFLFRAAERHVGRYTTMFVTVSNAMTRQYLQAGIGEPERYRRIFSGFDVESFACSKNDMALRMKLGIGPEDLVIGKIARLFELKGHDDLFAIAPKLIAQFPNLRFLFVGDGLWRERLEAKASALNLQKHFVFAGLVPPGEVCRYVGIMDALVHLSLREGLPRALPQALAARKPVVAYDCDGAGEVCLDGQTGFLIQPGDIASLSSRLAQLLGDAGLRQNLGKRGQSMVFELFPTEKMVAELERLYFELASGRPLAKSQ